MDNLIEGEAYLQRLFQRHVACAGEKGNNRPYFLLLYMASSEQGVTWSFPGTLAHRYLICFIHCQCGIWFGGLKNLEILQFEAVHMHREKVV